MGLLNCWGNHAAELYKRRLQRVEEWHDDMGGCVFLNLDDGDAMLTSPLSSDWKHDYWTHFIRLPEVE